MFRLKNPHIIGAAMNVIPYFFYDLNVDFFHYLKVLKQKNRRRFDPSALAVQLDRCDSFTFLK